MGLKKAALSTDLLYGMKILRLICLRALLGLYTYIDTKK